MSTPRGFSVQSFLSLRCLLRDTTACAASRMSCVRAVVLLQLDDGRVRVVALEVEDVAQVRAAPGVDALVVVTHHGQVVVALGERATHRYCARFVSWYSSMCR